MRDPRGTDPFERAELRALVSAIAAREVQGDGAAADRFVRRAGSPAPEMYANENARLGISFKVERLAFPGLQAMDPRVVRIAPGKTNERHRHAHESIFVILSGQGRVLVGDDWVDVATGDIAFVPRWIFHQTANTGSEPLVVLAITDFGLTSAALGDYDRRTRLREGGADSQETSIEEGRA